MRFSHFFARFFDPRFVDKSLGTVQELIMLKKNADAARELTEFSRLLRLALEPIAELDRPANIQYTNINNTGPVRLGKLDINPNFVFNAITVIQSLILDQDPRAIEYLDKFSSLMQEVLRSADKTLISLEKELRIVQNYISLQLVRFDNSFQYFVKVSKGLQVKQILVPRLVLQAIIERCIELGTRKLRNGMIHVDICLAEKDLLCMVSFNGKPIRLDQPEHTALNDFTKIAKQRMTALDRESWSINCAALDHDELYGQNITLQMRSLHK